MLRRLLIIGGIIAVIIGKYAWRERQRIDRTRQAFMDKHAPAVNSLSAERIVDADWSYSGPLGPLTLRFEPDGKLLSISDTATSTGRWEIHDIMLFAFIPGADKPHQGIFRTSTDELSGVSPAGMEPRNWSASRVRESE